MSYILPQPYKCEKCGHEQSCSPHNPHAAPWIQVESGALLPVCPVCFANFLAANTGLMQPVKSP